MPTWPDDIILNKAGIIEGCIQRIREEYAANPSLDDYTHTDALTLNIERAYQASIDLAMHIVAQQHLGIPQSRGQAFSLLRRAGFITEKHEQAMRGVSGFRNIAIHQYQDLDPEALRYIAEQGWKTLQEFCNAMGVTIKIP